MRLDQSVLAECTPTWARPRATSTENVSRHADTNFAEDQWYKSTSRSWLPAWAKRTQRLKNRFAAGPQTPPASKLNGTNLTECADSSCLRSIASLHDASFSRSPCVAPQPPCWYAVYPDGPETLGPANSRHGGLESVAPDAHEPANFALR